MKVISENNTLKESFKVCLKQSGNHKIQFRSKVEKLYIKHTEKKLGLN